MVESEALRRFVKANEMTSESGHVLVVDDNRMNRMKLSRGLEQQGHTVDVAENGKLALEMLRADS